MAEELKTQEAISAESTDGEKKKKKKKSGWIPIVIIAVVIVFVALLLTVLLVKDFNTLGDLFNFLGKQF